MHKDFDLNIKHVSKTEGHADLEIKVKGGKVKYARLKILEHKRFYTQAMRGKPFASVPQLVSRICGTCSLAHLTCSTEAMEKALGIQPSQQTMLLRKLAMYGLMIRDHALHLYFFSMPDLLGVDSVLDLDSSKDELLKKAFAVKAAGNALSAVVAGRAIHPTFEQIGYFSNIPKKEDAKKLATDLRAVRSNVLELIEMFYKSPFSYKRPSEFVALTTKDFSFLEGEICSTSGTRLSEEDYWDYLNRVIIPYSEATGFKFEGKEYMVGALARMNLNREALHRDTKRDCQKALSVFPSTDVFHNNLGQAIEILHSIDHSLEILGSAEFKAEQKPEVKMKEGKGVGVIEAPRGTLYHMVDLGKDGKVRYVNFIIPTAHNQIKMESDIKALIPTILKKSKHEIQHDVENLIRAYDPCMSCASHFLRIKWK